MTDDARQERQGHMICGNEPKQPASMCWQDMLLIWALVKQVWRAVAWVMQCICTQD